jgi:maleate cis-trans isomerase
VWIVITSNHAYEYEIDEYIFPPFQIYVHKARKNMHALTSEDHVYTIFVLPHDSLSTPKWS